MVFISMGKIILAQQYFMPYEATTYAAFEKKLYQPGSRFFTDIKPYLAKEVFNTYGDTTQSLFSIYGDYFSAVPFSKRGWYRKLRTEHLFDVTGEEYHIQIDPILHQESGAERIAGEGLRVNTRGVMVRGTLGKNLGFFSSYLENQASFVNYLDSFILQNRVVPGQGMIRIFKGANYDYASATGYIQYQPAKFLNLQFGHERNFIGDGYRSLLLSDNTYPYPFLKMITTVGPFRYMNLYGFMMDMRSPVIRDQGFQKKFVNIHYLSSHIGKRVTFSLFESITWGGNNRFLDPAYLNPVIFYHPIAFSDQSSANILLGANLKVIPIKNIVVYSQLMLDEFRGKDIARRNGWWGNKQGVQGGIKYFDVAGIKNLFLQTEFNYVRPYTYQYANTLTNYEHYNQPLAHPVGANFIESLSWIRYRYKSVSGEFKWQYLIYGDDLYGVNNGRRVYNNYLSRPRDFDIKTTDGLLNVITALQLTGRYHLNPRTGLVLESSLLVRNHLIQDIAQPRTVMITFGLRTLLFNRYYDF